MGEAEVYLYSFGNLVARWGWVVSATPALLYPRQRALVPNCTGGWEGYSVKYYL